MNHCTLIFDIGKTNKKLIVFNRVYKIVYHESIQFTEVVDDDGYPCEDLNSLLNWIEERLKFLMNNPKFSINRVNFSTYGASWVHLDNTGNPITPLYNYLKPFPEALKEQFDTRYDLNQVTGETGSPYDGMLNSGLQLYCLRHAKPELWDKIGCSLHLPQYLSYYFTGERWSDYPSIGCHTMLWDYQKKDYHTWVRQEGIYEKLAPIRTQPTNVQRHWRGVELTFGHGVHDSSAALSVYLQKSVEPFILLSTGTWCVAMNPFVEFKENSGSKFKGGLFYLTPDGKPVKATRLFLGNELAEKTKTLVEKFGGPANEGYSMPFNQDAFDKAQSSAFKPETLNFEQAYHKLIWGLVQKQVKAIEEARSDSQIRRLYVDGGFAKNEVFIKMLEYALYDWTVTVSENPEGTAMGAALLLD